MLGRPSERTEPDGKLKEVATEFWFAVQRMARRGADPPTNLLDDYPPRGDDDEYGSAGNEAFDHLLPNRELTSERLFWPRAHEG